MTRQEFTDAVAEVVGLLTPGLEVNVDTIARLADQYATTVAIEILKPIPAGETP